jgi:hypothetical protein
VLETGHLRTECAVIVVRGLSESAAFPLLKSFYGGGALGLWYLGIRALVLCTQIAVARFHVFVSVPLSPTALLDFGYHDHGGCSPHSHHQGPR